ncbi:MAG: helix-turn-helix domain-containing protein [Spirochaeta sp.]|nr:helix-turn-helix domain-containing protein [Spirochaeta sp.]
MPLSASLSPTELAYQVGYSDQAHMSRAVKRWFGVSPSEVLKRPDLAEQLHVPGYDAATSSTNRITYFSLAFMHTV